MRRSHAFIAVFIFLLAFVALGNFQQSKAMAHMGGWNGGSAQARGHSLLN